MYNFKLNILILGLLSFHIVICDVSIKKICADENCKEPISLAITTLRYSSPKPGWLSFPPKAEATIYSKQVGPGDIFWEAEINGKRGYVPPRFMREKKILIKNTVTIDTPIPQEDEVPLKTSENISEKLLEQPISTTESDLKPDRVQEPYEVVDGTTIFSESASTISPSLTQFPVHSTSVSPENNESVETSHSHEELNDPKTESLENITEKFQNPSENSTDSEAAQANALSTEEIPIKVVENDDSILQETLSSISEPSKVDSEETINGEQSQTVNKEETLSPDSEQPINFEDKVTEIETLPTETGTQFPFVETPSETQNVQGTTEAPSFEEAEPLPIEESVTPDPLKLSEEISETTTLEPELLSSNNETVESDDQKLPENAESSMTVSISQEDLDNVENSSIEIASADSSIETTADTSNLETILQSLEDKPEIVVSDAENPQSSISESTLAENSTTTEENIERGESPSIEDEGLLDLSSTIYNILNPASDTLSKDEESKSVESQTEVNSNVDTDTEHAQNPQEAVAISSFEIENNISNLVTEQSQQMETPIDDSEDPEAAADSEENPSSISAEVSEEDTSSGKTEWEQSSTPLSNVDQMQEEILSNVPEDSQYCDNDTCKLPLEASTFPNSSFNFNHDLLMYLSTSAISCIIFLLVYTAMDKNNRLKPLIAKINQLEKDLLVSLKENEELQARSTAENTVSSDSYDLLGEKLAGLEAAKEVLELEVMKLQKEVEDKQGLELQIEALEKELETSTEVGMELNRIIAEMLDPKDGSERLRENVEQLQRQLLEQKVVIEEGKQLLSDKEEELDASKTKTSELLSKLEEVVDQISKMEEAKEKELKSLQDEMGVYQQKYNEGVVKNEMLTNDVQALRAQLADTQRQAELRIKEYNILKESVKSVSKDPAVLQSLLDATSMKAEFNQLKSDNETHLAQLKQEQAAKTSYEEKCRKVLEENQALTKKFREAEKEKVEVDMKLEVLTNYFKKKEEELQGEILRYKSIWEAKKGEATSTTERIKLMQEEIENYKSQNETLKQEVISQEIDLKSQISMLEKKVHENWVNARQNERKLEDAKQEAAQLRNRITLGERNQNRLQSPVDQNGDLTMSTTSFDSPASPLFGNRDRLTQSPPTLPPFMPPPGVPFMPPPPHGMPFVPPPLPGLFPGDRRPPPLGRLSSPPPLRYTPDSMYDGRSPSPPYDSEYGASPPPPLRRYDAYDREFERVNGRSKKGPMMSSGSDHSVESIDKSNRKHSKMV